MKKIASYWLVFIFVLIFFLRLPSLFTPYSYGDEGIYLTLGEAARRGLVFYRDIYDNKPPLLYLLAAVSGSLFWFRFLLLGWNLATIYLFFKLAQLLFLRKENLIKIATLIFAVLSSIPLFEGNIANAEIFMILPITLGIFLFFKEKTKKPINYFFIGVLFSLATLFKVPAVFDFLAILVFFVFFLTRAKVNWKLEIGNLSFLLLGFSLPIIFTFIYWGLMGGLKQYFTAAFMQNLPYLSSWQSGKSSFGFNFSVINRGILLLFVTAILWFFRKKWEEVNSFLIIWFLFALFGATLSGRPYPHYLIQILAPASLLFIAVFTANNYLKIIILGFLSLILASWFYFHFWYYSTLPYYQNFLSFTLKQKTHEEYFRAFGDRTLQTYKLAEFLQVHTQKEEKVFIWGEGSVVYALSRRLPPGRYAASYHIIDFGGYEETMKALVNQPTRFIIDLNDENRPFPEFAAFIAQNYHLFSNIDKAEIFLHNLPK